MANINAKMLLRIINEEIDTVYSSLLNEQAPPTPDAPVLPDDPAAAGAPPADGAPPTDDKKEEEEKDPDAAVKKKIEDLSREPDQDIRKTFLSKMQNGIERKEAIELLQYVVKNKNEASKDKKVPENIKRVVDQLQLDFNIKIPPPEPEKPKAPAAAAPAAPAAPVVAESRVQKLAREYLVYKKLYLRSN
jgi:hypothetical protein